MTKSYLGRSAIAMALGILGLVAALSLISPRSGAASAAAGPCEGLAKLALPNTKIAGVESIAAGTWTPPGDVTPNSRPRKIHPIENMPAFCRVMATVSPVADSEIEIEVWLPAMTGWNGKLQSIGNHYFAGGIFYEDMAAQLRRGYATSGTSMGHVGTGHLRWAYGHPEKVIDLAHRANHEMAVLAKQVIAAYYGKAPRYSYFQGCSTGGREALKIAQMYPEDYDGVIAGGASSNYTGYNTQLIVIGKALSGPNKISTPQFNAVHKSILKKCDALDGVKDGLLENPRACNWKPAEMLCKAGDNPETCLTPGQASALETVYSPIHDPVTKEMIVPGIAPGSEFDITQYGINKGGPHEAPLMLFALAHDRERFDPANFDLHKDVQVFDQKIGRLMGAKNPDLAAFKARGGKLIEYKGWGDVISNPNWAARYYENVVEKMGGVKDVQAFYRLFLMPGVGHCTRGPGPNTIGALEQPKPPKQDAEHDVVAALEAWVEQGRAPDHIVATKYLEDDPAKGIVMQRPVCPYPSVARWNGKGDTNLAANFRCKAR